MYRNSYNHRCPNLYYYYYFLHDINNYRRYSIGIVKTSCDTINARIEDALR